MAQRKKAPPRRTPSPATGPSHYHFSVSDDALFKDSHPGGAKRHQHPRFRFRGYGRTRDSFTLL